MQHTHRNFLKRPGGLASRRLVSLPVALLLLGACDEPPPAATLKETPAQFIGVWDVSVGDCQAGAGPSRVTVAADEVMFPDSRLDVTGALPDGESAARIDGHLTTSMGNADTSIRLELSDGGAVLSVVNGSTIVPRVKCP